MNKEKQKQKEQEEEDKFLLGAAGKMVLKNFLELDKFVQGEIVDRYIGKFKESEDVNEVMKSLAQKEIDWGNSRHDFMETASWAYSELKDDDDFSGGQENEKIQS